jgi:hypothetical protein
MEKFLTGRDTDLVILENLNDRDLLTTCLVNKSANRLCKDDNFWRNRFIRKWGEHEKPKNKSWKFYYLLIIKFLEDEEPIQRSFNYAMNTAAKEGYIDIVKLMIEKGAMDFNRAMKTAAKEGHIDIVKLMLDNEATDFNWGLYYAAWGGHLDILQLMIDKGASDFAGAMVWAKKGANENVINGNKTVINYLENLIG